MKKTILLTALLVLIAASPAMAALNEYYTYGGFSPVTIAFQNIALIFSDNNYKGAITAFALLGLFFAGAGGFFNMISGKGGPLGWVVPTLMGAMIYFSLYIPVTNLYVYDPVYNQNLTVAGVPVGVAYTAGLINHLERFVVNIFDANASLAPNTACGQMAAMQYQEMGGAVGMRLMQSSASQYVQDANASSALSSYIDDCVQFEMTRPGATLTLNQLLSPGCGKSALDVMGQAASPSNFTSDYLNDPTGNTTISCQQAYSNIQAFYTNAAHAGQSVSNACGGTNFTDQARCQQILTDMLQGTTGESIPATTFIGNNSVANITSNALVNGGGAATTQYMTMLNQAQTGQSSGFMSGIMNPYMIDAYVAYSFMLMPILALFLVTPLWKNAFTLSISLVAWTCLLRSLDVITFHQWVVQYQQAAAATLNNAGSGLDAAMRLPTLSNQYLGTFASMRNSVFLLATAVSGALFKFGDSAMSRLADKASAAHDGIKEAVADRGVAAQRALSVATGASRAEMVTALAAGAHGWQNLGGGLAANELSSAASGAGALAAAGGNIGGLMNSTQQSSTINHAQDFAKTGNLSQPQAQGMGVNDAAAQKAVLQNLGSDGKLAGYMADMATKKNIGETQGAEQAWHNAQAAGYKGDYQTFAKDVAQVATEKNFADSAGYRQFVSEKFGGNEAAAIQAITDVAAFQVAKHAGEVGQTMAGTGQSAVGVGGDLGKTGGDNNLMSMASDNVRRAIAEQNVPEDIKKDPALYQNGHITEAGYAAQMGNIAGANQQSFVKADTAYGPVDKRDVVDRSGNKIMGQEKGSVHNAKEMHALAKELRANGFTHAAKELDSMAENGKGFDFQISRDGQNNITGFSALGGATAQLNDKATEDRGRLNQYTNLDSSHTGRSNVREDTDKTVIDKGLRETVGSFIKSGYSNEQLNTTAFHGAATINVDGKATQVQGDWYYDKKGHLIGGAFQNGSSGDVLAYKTDVNGAQHFSRVTGKFDSKGQMIQGTASSLTSTQFIEAIKDSKGNTSGMAATTRTGDRHSGSISVHADGSKDVNVSQTYTFGAAVKSQQTLAGSAAGNQFTNGNSLAPGTGSLVTAGTEQTIAVGAEKVAQAGALLKPGMNLSKSGPEPGTPGHGTLHKDAGTWVKNKLGVGRPNTGHDPRLNGGIGKLPSGAHNPTPRPSNGGGAPKGGVNMGGPQITPAKNRLY